MEWRHNNGLTSTIVSVCISTVVIGYKAWYLPLSLDILLARERAFKNDIQGTQIHGAVYICTGTIFSEVL